MKILKLNKYTALVDNEDYNRVIKYGNWVRWKRKWSNTYYITCQTFNPTKTIFLHQFILNFPFLKNRKIIHHKNGKGWDCRKRNLEITTQSEHAKMHVLNGGWLKNSPHQIILKFLVEEKMEHISGTRLDLQSSEMRPGYFLL